MGSGRSGAAWEQELRRIQVEGAVRAGVEEATAAGLQEVLWRVAELELAGLSAIVGLVWDRAIAGELPTADLRRVLAWLRSALADIDLADGVLTLARERATIVRGLAADVAAMWPEVDVDNAPPVEEADLPPPDALAALGRSICRHAPPRVSGGASRRPSAGRCVVST